MRRRHPSFVIVLALILTACGSGQPVESSTTTAPPATTTTDSDTSSSTTAPPNPTTTEQSFAAGDLVVHRAGRSADFPTVHDGILYANLEGDLVAMDVEDLSTLWRFEASADIQVQVAFHDGVVYAVDMSGRYHAINPESGRRIWQTPGGGAEASTVTAGDGRVIGNSRGELTAFDAATGEEVWTFAESGFTSNWPAMVHDGMVYLAGSGGLRSLDAATGALRWRVTGWSATGIPSAGDGLVFATDSNGIVHAISISTGQEAWRSTVTNVRGRWMVLSDGLLFVGTSDGMVHALDPGTGSVTWSYDAKTPAGQISIWAGGGAVFVTSAFGRAHALDAATGEELWTFNAGENIGNRTPAWYGDLVFFAGNNGIYAVATDSRP